VRSEQSFGRGVMASRTTGSATHIGDNARVADFEAVSLTVTALQGGTAPDRRFCAL
jgi:hypothetical protein